MACRCLKGAVPEEEEEQTFVLICKHGNGRGPPGPNLSIGSVGPRNPVPRFLRRHRGLKGFQFFFRCLAW